MLICVLISVWTITYFNPFFVLTLDGEFNAFSDKFIIFSYSIVIYYIILNSSIIYCLFGDIHLSFVVSILFASVNKTFCKKFFEALATLPIVLLPIKSPVAPAIFLLIIASVVDVVALSRRFWLYLLLKFLSIFLENDKKP